jgi:hypothetical protein
MNLWRLLSVGCSKEPEGEQGWSRQDAERMMLEVGDVYWGEGSKKGT